jgi:hypothetical protein
LLIAQIPIFYGCSSSTSNPVSGTGGTGGTSSIDASPPADDGGAAQCASGVKNKGACTTEPACFNTCGPLKSGKKNCTCAAGMWSCPSCTYDPPDNSTGAYNCYKLPATLTACPQDPNNPDPSGMNLPASGDACTIPPCMPCGSATNNAYRDSSGTPKIGYCVCSSATSGTYSCASTTEWAPQ